MSYSVEELWKTAPDEEVVAAVGRWDSTNEAAQRALAAEVRRRGLNVKLPEIAPSKAAGASASSSTPMQAWIAAGVVIAAFVVLAVFIG